MTFDGLLARLAYRMLSSQLHISFSCKSGLRSRSRSRSRSRESGVEGFLAGVGVGVGVGMSQGLESGVGVQLFGGWSRESE